MFRNLTPASAALLAGLLATVMLSGCAGLNTLTSEVSSHSQWPAGRKPGTASFERLPSQQAQPERQAQLEDAAARALQAAGFTVVPTGAGAGTNATEYTVQLGARVTPSDSRIFEDPFWWRGGLYGAYGRGWPGSRGPFWGAGIGMRFDHSAYEREVGLLIRDRQTGQVLYEAHASNEGMSSSIESLLAAMYSAALQGFPEGSPAPRNINTPLGP